MSTTFRHATHSRSSHMDSPDDEVVGKVGRITLGITPDHAGEVILAIRGGT